MSVDPFDKNVPTITLDKEDREAFQRTRQKGNTKVTPEPLQSESTNVRSGPSGFFLFVIFLLALGGASASAWLVINSQEQHEQLLQAQNRIQDLENQLSATGEEMGSSAAEIQARVSKLSAKSEELWDQMDKLWASAWRRNQQDIKDLSKQLTNESADLKKLLAQMTTEVEVGATNDVLWQEKFEQLVSRSQQLSNLLDQGQQKDKNIESQMLELAGLLANTDLAISELARQVSANQSNIQRSQTPPKTTPKLPTPVGVSPTGNE